MKIVSFLLVLFSLVWTWSYVHSENAIQLESHQAIEQQLVDIIIQKIQVQKPDATEVRVERIWSEVLDAKTIKAHFIYAFTDASGAVSNIKASGLVKKTAESPTEEKWSFSDIKTDQDSVVFENMEIISRTETQPDEGTLLNPVSPSTTAPVPTEE